jgi:predicted transcriptional regulator
VDVETAFIVGGEAPERSVIAAATDQDFKVVNITGYQIDNVHVTPHSSDNWGRNILVAILSATAGGWTSPSRTAPAPATSISR